MTFTNNKVETIGLGKKPDNSLRDASLAIGGAFYASGYAESGSGAPSDLASLPEYRFSGTTSFTDNQALATDVDPAKAANMSALGGAVHLRQNSRATFDSVGFRRNHASSSGTARGGAVAIDFDTDYVLYSANLAFTGSIFEENQALGSQFAQGGTVYLPFGFHSLTGARLDGNAALASAATEAAEGGAVYFKSIANDPNPNNPTKTLTIAGTDFENNKAEATAAGGVARGGAIYHDGSEAGSTATLELTNTSFTGNQAGTFGGAVYAAGGTVKLIGNGSATSTYSGNTAGAGSAYGGITLAASSQLNFNVAAFGSETVTGLTLETASAVLIV